MKNIFIVLIGFIFSYTLYAQPLSGNYTIGGSVPDYVSINAAVTALSTQGVNGAVTFLIRNGTYNEHISLNSIAGASAANTITFRSQSGDSTAVVLNWTTTSAVPNGILLNQSAYIRFHQLTVRQNSSVSNNAVVLIGRGHNITISNCVLWGHQSSTSSATDYVIAGTCDSNLIVSNNVLRGAVSGFIATNTALVHERLKVTGNEFFGITQDYFYVQGGVFAEVSGNSFDVGGSLTANAIFLTQVSRATVWGNRIRIQNTAQNSSGIRITSSAGFPAQPILVANNAISYDAGGALVANGIICSGTFQMQLVYNSVRINGGINSSAIQIPSGGDITLLNNVFAHESTGTANHAVNIPTTLSNIVSNYNNLYAAGANLAPTFTTLAAYQAATAREANSVSVVPQFISAANLYATAAAQNNSATPLSNVTTDINGSVRGNPFPDMGAFEQLSMPVVALGADTVVCDSVLLQTGSNPGSTWLWSTGATTSSVTVTASGSYWVRITNLLGSASDTIVITVNSSPVALANAAADSVCAGNCVLLQAAVTGGSGAYTYVWQPAAGLSNAALAAPLACISTSSTYQVTVTDSAGCTAQSNLVSIGLYAQPQLSTTPALSSCAGDTVLLSATTQTPGCSFGWQPAALTAQPLQAQTQAWPPQGVTTFTLTATTPQGCTDTALLQTTLHALPAVPVITQNGPQLQSSAASGNQWYLAGQPVAGATDSVFIPLQNGSYTVAVTDSNGCTSVSAPYVMLNTGNGQISYNAELTLWPNPVNDQLLIYLLAPLRSLKIYNAAGQIMFSSTEFDTTLLNVPVSIWPAGIYSVQATQAGGEILHAKFVKISL
jgi:hypothetical protein